IRSRRSSRPSWSRSVFTLRAAGSLSTTPGVCVSCTVMFCPPTSEGPAAAVPAAGQHRRCGASSHCTVPGLLRRDVRTSALDLLIVKLRLPGRRSTAGTTDPSTDMTDQLVKGTGKGRPTPKRSEAQGRRPGPPPPPPTTRKEAYKRMRENQAANRVNARSAAARGDDSYLPRRDQGPAKRLVRHPVDSRRNVGSLFLIVAGIAVVGTIAPSLVIRSYASFLLFAFFLVFIGDSVLLARKIKRTLAERLPKESPKGAVWYGVSRSTMIRRWRFPKPEVALGAEL